MSENKSSTFTKILSKMLQVIGAVSGIIVLVLAAVVSIKLLAAGDFARIETPHYNDSAILGVLIFFGLPTSIPISIFLIGEWIKETDPVWAIISVVLGIPLLSGLLSIGTSILTIVLILFGCILQGVIYLFSISLVFGLIGTLFFISFLVAIFGGAGVSAGGTIVAIIFRTKD